MSPALVVADDRRGAPAGNVFWAADHDQVGQVLHGTDPLGSPPRCSKRADIIN
jgi:hypothetical protein